MTNTNMRFNDDGVLLCPECGFEYTHVDRVVVYARPGEDRPATAITVRATGDMNASAHPGIQRRHAIELHGRCEDGHEFTFRLTQHKGQTFIT